MSYIEAPETFVNKVIKQFTVRSLLEILTPAPMDEADKALYQQWVRSMGSSQFAAKLLVSEGVLEPDAEKLLHKLALYLVEKRRNGAVDTLSLHDIIMGNSDRYREPELAEIDFRTRLDADIYQEIHVREDHKALEAKCAIDWDAVNEYRDCTVDSPFKGVYMGKKPLIPSRKRTFLYKDDSGKMVRCTYWTTPSKWFPNYTIRLLKDGKISKERVPLTDFGPWAILSENRLVKEFSQRWFQDKRASGRLLGVAKIPMSGDEYRYGGVMQLPDAWQNTARVQRFMKGKEGQLVLCCPMTKDGHDKFVKSCNQRPWEKYRKVVLTKNHFWITVNKVAEGQLEATVWCTIEQSTGNAVTRMSRATFDRTAWKEKKAKLLREGWKQTLV
jgi:hypothetical protein